MKIIDLHCDTISEICAREQRLLSNDGHFDLERARESGLIIQFFALFTKPDESSIAMGKVQEQIRKYQYELETNKQMLYPIKCQDDLKKGMQSNKIGSILHLEGAEAIGKDIEVLYSLFQAGLRSMGLTWNKKNFLADGIGEGPNAGGLTSLGREVVREMEKMGMILDAAHISVAGFFDILEIYDKPLLVTHANTKALCNHPRNLSREQLLALADNGGIIGVTQVDDFVRKTKIEQVTYANNYKPDTDELIDHIVYIADLIGVKHVALGSDFDGADDIVMAGIEDYDKWPGLLRKRGFSEREIQMILSENALRVIKRILQ